MSIVRMTRRSVPLSLLLLTAAARAAGPSTVPASPPVACLQQPAASPDGREVAFVTAGAIWTVPAAGGDARPLVADVGDVLRPLYSPDGRRLAFGSNKTGAGDLYVLTFDTGELKRVTVDESPDRLDAWAPDGRSLYYSTGGHEVGGTSDVYRVDVDGGTPMPVVAEPYGGDFYAAPSPDGHTVAFCGGGLAASQWWRHGHSHIDCCAIWSTTDGHGFVQLTTDDAKHLWPMWSPDARTLYYMADADGAENLYGRDYWNGGATSAPAAPPTALTHFRDGRVLWPTISADGKTIVFERDFGIWKLDLTTGAVGPIAVRLRGVVAPPAVPVHLTLTRDASEMAVSHDGKKVAVVVHGQVFAGPVAAGETPAPAFRVTHSDGIESDVTWSNDDRKLAYVSTRGKYRHVYVYDFATRLERPVTTSAANDASPAFAPDDAAVAFVRNGAELRLVELRPPTLRRRPSATQPVTLPTAGPTAGPTTGPATVARPAREPRRQILARIAALRAALGLSPERVLATGLSVPQPPFAGRRAIAFAPAGDYVAVVSAGAKGFRNVYLVPTAGGPARQVSFLANAESSAAVWTPDGSALLFGSGQRTEENELARVDLKPRPPAFRTDQFSDLFRQRPTRPTPEPTTPRQPTGDADGDADGDAEPATTRATIAAPTGPTTIPTTIPATRPAHTDVVFDDIEERLGLLPVGLDVDEVAVSPDGKWAGVIGSAGGRTNVYVYPLDPLVEAPVARQLTATADGKSDLQFAPDPDPRAEAAGATRLYFREGGRVRYVPVPARAVGGGTGGVEAADVPVPVEMDVGFDRDKRVVFDQAWRYLADHFHDPAMHGLDWPAVRARFAPHLDAARTPADERRVLSLMIGELNSSHMAVSGPPTDDGRANVGRLGVTWDAAEYAAAGKLRVAAVVPFGPAALAGIKVGQFVAAVDAAPADRPANVDALLENKSAKDVTLAVADDAAGGGKHDVRVVCVSPATERTLAYKAWVHANRTYVARASGNRLGYIHLSDMSTQALARLSADLDARNQAYDGVVVDVRNNNGGFVNGYALDVFSRRNYLDIQGRDTPRTTGRTALGQRYLGLPTVLVTNRDTLSDGEDFTEGYQALGLGDTVGEPTAGWIIFTSGVTLLDGSSLRLPAESVYDHNGVEMEMHPRPVTTLVERPVGEASEGRDSQLDAAVKDLLGKLPAK